MRSCSHRAMPAARHSRHFRAAYGAVVCAAPRGDSRETMHRHAMEASAAGAVNAMPVPGQREYAGSTGMKSASVRFAICHLFHVNDTSVSLQPPRTVAIATTCLRSAYCPAFGLTPHDAFPGSCFCRADDAILKRGCGLGL